MAQTIAPRPNMPKPLRKRPKVELPYPLNLVQTSIGLKWIMALSGVGLIGFVLAHMAGNFKLYQGQGKVAEYAHALREIGTPILPDTWFLWIMRIGLIAMFGVHIYAAIALTRMSGAANQKYSGSQDFMAANYASRTMRWTGPIILLYLVWHLMDLTWGWVNPDFEFGDPYHNLQQSLSSIPVAIIYIVANVALAVHVFHGVFSLFASLGIVNAKINLFRKPLAAAIAGVILVGNLSFPILAMTGVIDENDTHSVPCKIDGEYEIIEMALDADVKDVCN